jgi:hypothetical protein
VAPCTANFFVLYSGSVRYFIDCAHGRGDVRSPLRHGISDVSGGAGHQAKPNDTNDLLEYKKDRQATDTQFH